MEQLRHRLMNISPEGQRRSVDRNTVKRSDLDDFVACYNHKNRHDRKESEPGGDSRRQSDRFRSFSYEELIKRDKINHDTFWLKDESLEDSANLPDPDVLAREIVEDLEAALQQFSLIAADLKK
jgi:type I restriction enzyme M protein